MEKDRERETVRVDSKGYIRIHCFTWRASWIGSWRADPPLSLPLLADQPVGSRIVRRISGLSLSLALSREPVTVYQTATVATSCSVLSTYIDKKLYSIRCTIYSRSQQEVREEDLFRGWFASSESLAWGVDIFRGDLMKAYSLMEPVCFISPPIEANPTTRSESFFLFSQSSLTFAEAVL